MKMEKSGRRFRMQALAAAVGLASGAVQAADFEVSNLADDGAGSLRQALLDAQGDGGQPSEITFASGVSGTITLNTPLPLLTHATTIQGQGITLTSPAVLYDPLLQISVYSNDQDMVIRGLTISGTNAGAIDADLDGASGSSLVLDGVTVADNEGRSAVRLRRGDFKLLNSVITGNNSGEDSGAGVNVRYGELLIRDSKITNNTIPDDSSGAGISSGYATLTIERSVITGNETGGSGGGIRARGFGSDVSISDSTISGNTAEGGAGISFYVPYFSDGSLTILRSSISNNIAKASEEAPERRGPSRSTVGGIEFSAEGTFSESSFELTDSIVEGNTAGYAAGMQIEAPSVVISRSLIRNNTAEGAVGAFDIEADSLQIVESTITGNSAAETAIGGISYRNSDSVNWTINSSTISDNHSSDAVRSAGLEVEIYDGSFNIENSTISGNSSATSVLSVDGYAGNEPLVSIKNSTFSGNSSSANPAVFRAIDTDVTVVNSTFVDNSGTTPGDLEVGTAQLAVFNEDDGEIDLTLRESVFSSGNDAEVSVGGQAVNQRYSYVPGEGGTYAPELTGDNYAVGFTIENVIMTGGLAVDIESSGSGTGSPLEVAAGLAPLGYRGGFTLVHEPATGSEAIDAGPSVSRADDRDQRGLEGYYGEGQDLGSVEVVGNQPPRPLADVGRQISGVLGKEIPALDVAALFTDADGDDISVIDVSGLPAGLYFGEGTISGTLEVAGTYHVTVVVEDSNVSPLQAVEQVVVTVTETAPRKKKDSDFLGSMPAGVVALFAFLGLLRRRVAQ